jgi:hypothetical protein
VNAEVAREALDAFADGPWGRKYPAIVPASRRQWEQIVPFFTYPPQVRRIIYTTDEIDKPPVHRIACFSVDDEFARAETTQRSLIQTRPVSQSTSMPVY